MVSSSNKVSAFLPTPAGTGGCPCNGKEEDDDEEEEGEEEGEEEDEV